MKKPKIKSLLLLLLVIAIASNLYMHHKFNHFIHQKQSQNQTDLWSISVSGENLAKRLEDFLQHSHEADNEEVKEILDNSWRVVLGESQSIRFYLGRVSPQDMEELAPRWSLLQYSLLRIDDFLHGLNFNFLEQRSYSINNEEVEKLKAVVTTYKKIHEAVKNKSEHPELVIDSLTDQMMIIDHHYASILETLELD
ncbi:hypothetical protein D3P08_03445 [Paenibacillus nanensis]|uniref:Uncharacterized protein n=1 Tax=Paenibacillus nanensis TaxID=393251 RepID=A0A3A1VL37_9BACL|nr:hypothetical protein D3P08_03445 [Paenibacillus nanensis]